jgi:hypothetical protein
LDTNSIKGSPTPSITSDSLISDDLASLSNKSCFDSNQTCRESRSSLSSTSTISLSSDDDKNLKNSPSNDSLNSNKRITRNPTRAIEAPFAAPLCTSANSSHEDSLELNPNRKKCLWHRCRFSIDADKSNDELIEHVKSKHIQSQKSCKKFRCLWTGCNVYEKPSSSFMWLERHVTDHIDTRPFSCVFSGCNKKFRTETELGRHCELHCDYTPSSANSYSLTSQLNTLGVPLHTSPVKNRQQKHGLLNTTTKAIIQNIKQKNKSSSQLNELSTNSLNGKFDRLINGSGKFANAKSKSSSNLANGNHTVSNLHHSLLPRNSD